jgi:hypothetical protein
VPTPARSQGNHGYTYSDDQHIRATVLSIKKTAGIVQLVLSYENLSNVDTRIAFYSGGANGQNTILVDGNGEQWEMTEHTERDRQLLSHVPVRVTLTFSKPVGDVSATTFSLINWIHWLPEQGDYDFLKAVISDIPLNLQATAAASKAPATPSAVLEFDSDYLHVYVVSTKKTGGTVSLSLLYENAANVAYRIAQYHGGANGRNTILVDNNGDQWEMASNDLGGKQFMPHVKTRVNLNFTRATGGNDATTFTLVGYAQILDVAGATLDADWVKLTISGIPVPFNAKP